MYQNDRQHQLVEDGEEGRKGKTKGQVTGFSNYSKRITRGNKNEGREVETSNVADENSSKPTSFEGEERENKLIKKCIEIVEWEESLNC